MSLKTILICGSVAITAILTIAYTIFERRRYLTNNPNATGDDFQVHPDPNCSICLESIESRESILLSCGHFLHQRCLEDMDRARDLLQTNRCPVCRTPIRYP